VTSRNHFSRVARDIHFAIHALAQTDQEFKRYHVHKTIHNVGGLKLFLIRDKKTGQEYSVSIRRGR
jgi:hypothetical protein